VDYLKEKKNIVIYEVKKIKNELNLSGFKLCVWWLLTDTKLFYWQ